MNVCKHAGYEVDCKGDVRRTKHGMLCGCHAYKAFLRERCGVEVEPDAYGAKSEYEGTMFADNPRKQLADLTNIFLNNLAEIAEEEGEA
jgi:hypothetical protein